MKIMQLIWTSPEGCEVVKEDFTIYNEEDEKNFENIPLSEDYHFREKPFSDTREMRKLADFVSENGYDPTEDNF